MKRFLKILSVLLLSLFIGCGDDNKDEGQTDPEIGTSSAWTIMIWLDGDNDLESAAMQDLNEMEYGLYLAKQADPDIDSKIKIIVQLDRAPGYDSSTLYTGKDWTDTRRYYVRPDSSVNYTLTSQRIDNDLGEINMGDASALKDFITYCKTYISAPKYGLILWNHGGGLRKKSLTKSDISDDEIVTKGVCWDETSNDDFLYTGEITDVLTSTESVDFLGFDACFMGMLEVAYEYRPGSSKFGADAIAFSPATEQKDGWEYQKIFNRFASGSTDSEGDTCYAAGSITANIFAEIVAKEYKDAFSSQSGETQTAVDNTKVEAVKTALDAFAAKIATGSNYKTVIEAIRGSDSSTVTMEYFDETSASAWLSYSCFDLYDFAERVEDGTITDVTFGTEITDLKTKIEEFILYSWGGSSYSSVTTSSFQQGKNGLSFFFPDGDRTYTSTSGTYPHIAYQWWYTSLDTNSDYAAGYYYGKIDFCDGDGDGTVDNWYELIIKMYDATLSYHPGPGY